MEGEEIDFNGIDEDLEQFQQDDIVRQALLQGVDLRGYARDIDLELREVRGCLRCTLRPCCEIRHRMYCSRNIEYGLPLRVISRRKTYRRYLVYFEVYY